MLKLIHIFIYSKICTHNNKLKLAKVRNENKRENDFC